MKSDRTAVILNCIKPVKDNVTLSYSTYFKNVFNPYSMTPSSNTKMVSFNCSIYTASVVKWSPAYVLYAANKDATYTNFW